MDDLSREGVAVHSEARRWPEAATVVRARLGAGIRVELADLTPALAASLRHAASMHNPLFCERQRMRSSAWDIPRFLQFFDVAPRGFSAPVAGEWRRPVLQGRPVPRTSGVQPGT